jgi:hypothetical protein
MKIVIAGEGEVLLEHDRQAQGEVKHESLMVSLSNHAPRRLSSETITA